MGGFARLGRWFFVAAFTCGACGAAADASRRGELETALIAPWRVTVAGEARTRILTISAVTEKADGTFALAASYGWAYATPAPLDARATDAGGQLTLDFVTGSGARVSVIQNAVGMMEGAFVARNGVQKVVRIARISASEAKAEVEAERSAYAAETLVPPARDVPAECAAFWGGWAGNWAGGGGALRLWVVSVDAECRVRYSYRRSTSPDLPASFGTAWIRDGALELPCSGGTCHFERHGDVLWSRYSSLFVLSNRPAGAVFERIR